MRIAPWLLDLHPLAQRLESAGVELLYPVARLGEGSLITAVRDPDGNVIELTQMGRSWVEHLREHRGRVGDLLSRSGGP